MQYSLPSPVGGEPYWQEVSSMECAPIATTEEDTLMEMSEVQVWPSGASPSLVAVEDSSLSLEWSNADEPEGALSLPYGSLGRPGSGASGASGGGVLGGSTELAEDDTELGADSEHASVGFNHNGLDGGQRSEVRRSEAAAGSSMTAGTGIVAGEAGGVERPSSEDGLSLVAGQQRVYARLSESPGLTRVTERNGDRSGGGSFLSYLQEQPAPGWTSALDSAQNWAGGAAGSKLKQAESAMSSVRVAVGGDSSQFRVSQESLLQPVRDLGHSEVLHGHFRGTQPFEKGLGFSHRAPELRAWEEARLSGQGDELEDIPGEQVSEEQFTDEHGNIVTKKIVRKVVRRGKGSGEDGGQPVSVEGLTQEPAELEPNSEQFVNYAILGRDSSKELILNLRPPFIDT